ncbi:MAG: hypothetical protein Ct9H300mP14_02860 [Gammaproteobacteria bacterium]|nr:MAG: hypothetical protein Ct9H300mP14_02860 [Gammaproteobacteria bacterium]
MNAYVRPGMRRYLDNFPHKLESDRFNSRYTLRSDSGLMGVERAMESPVYTLLSGPPVVLPVPHTFPGSPGTPMLWGLTWGVLLPMFL